MKRFSLLAAAAGLATLLAAGAASAQTITLNCRVTSNETSVQTSEGVGYDVSTPNNEQVATLDLGAGTFVFGSTSGPLTYTDDIIVGAAVSAPYHGRWQWDRQTGAFFAAGAALEGDQSIIMTISGSCRTPSGGTRF